MPWLECAPENASRFRGQYVIVSLVLLCSYFVPQWAYALVNINTAGTAELQTLTGIGEVKAGAIIDYRDAFGPFTALAQIKNVDGIGDVTYENIKPHITLGSAADDTDDGTGSEDEQDTEADRTSDHEANDSDGSDGETVTLTLPEASLSLAIDAPAVASVNQPIELSVTPTGIAETLFDSLTYEWNFGDATTAAGETVTHTYAYPGNYVVQVAGEFARHSATARIELTVVPANLSLMRTEQGDVQINNDAPYEIDLSGFTIRSTRSFILPERTILLPRATITVPRERVGGSVRTSAALFDREYEMVASFTHATDDPAPRVRGAATARAATVPNATTNSDTPPRYTFADDVARGATSTMPATTTVSATYTPATTTMSSSSVFPERSLPYLGLIAVLGTALIAVYAGRMRREDDIASTYY